MKQNDKTINEQKHSHVPRERPIYQNMFILAFALTCAALAVLVYSTWSSYQYFSQTIQPDSILMQSISSTEHLNTMHHKFIFTLVFACVSLPLLFLVWLAVFQLVWNHDIERKKNEQRLEEEKNHLSALIDAIPDEIAIKDVQRRFVLANLACIRALGRESAADVVGKRDEDLITEDVAADARLQEEHVLATGTPLLNKEALEYMDPISGRIKRAILISRIPIRDKEGTIAGLIVVNRDITGRKRAEEEREKLVAELQEAAANIKTLSGLIPICASCKKIRDDKGYWNQVEGYIMDHSDVTFTHGVCPDCVKKLYGDLYKKKL